MILILTDYASAAYNGAHTVHSHIIRQRLVGVKSEYYDISALPNFNRTRFRRQTERGRTVKCKSRQCLFNRHTHINTCQSDGERYGSGKT